VPSPNARSASLLDLDAELIEILAPGERAEARRLTSGRLVAAPSGPTTIVERIAAMEEVLGIYLADGVLYRETTLGRAGLPELLGPGEMLMPTADPESVVATATSTRCVEPATLLVLGTSYAHALARWPALLRRIEERRARQAARARTLAAIAHLPRVEVRVLAVLWHLAETWGRVHPEGTVVPFPLTHTAIGRFVRARRPTVSLATGELEEHGLLCRLADGTWMLPSASAAALQDMLESSTSSAPLTLRSRVSRAQSREMIGAYRLTETP
jgi:CRP-like cAMP-binding protein